MAFSIRNVGAAVSCLVGLASSASGQVHTKVKASDTVRVWAEPLLKGQESVVRRVLPDTIVIARTSRGSHSLLDTPVPMTRVTRIEILESRASSTERKFAGAFLGLVIGAGTGAMLGYHLGDDSCTDCRELDTPKTKRGLNAFVGGIGGMAIGVLAGSVAGANPVAKWRSVFP